MGFWSLFQVASMPIMQMLIVSVIGAIMATDRFSLLLGDTRKSLNKIVFVAFTLSLIFACLAESVTFGDIISWWFMPINIGMTFLFGGTLGWIAVKLIKPDPQLEGLIVAMCETVGVFLYMDMYLSTNKKLACEVECNQKVVTGAQQRLGCK